jgi:serine/threonine-protein phosphatase 6 regulatory ankyrin repeat subunit B
MLLQHPNVRVNDTAWYKITPLHVAARFACPKVVELLINDPRVKVDATTDLGFTALHLVAEGDENPDRDLGSRRPQEDRCKVVHMLLQAQRTLRSSDVGCHLNRSDDFKRFPIHYGVECDSVEVVEELLKWDDIDINAQDIHGLTPLHLAIQSKADNREAIVKLLLHVENIDINMGSGMPSTNQKLREWEMPSNWRSEYLPFRPMEQEGSTNLTALHFAARTGSPEIVDLLFREPGIKINVQDDDGCTPLHIAAQAGHVNVVERFLGQDPCLIGLTTQNSNSFTPLDLAIDKGHVAVVKVLLQFTAESDLTRKNSCSGNTTLHIATKSGCVEVTNMLLEHANELHFNEENMDGNIPFHLDSEEGNVDEVKVVVDHVESYLKEENNEKNTPLHLAAEGGHAEVVQLLLERCSTLDLEVKNAHGNTLLHQATMNGHDKVVQVLLDHAATEFDFDDKNNDGNTPLHLAAKEGHVEVVRVLLGCGLELRVDAKNKDCNTPLHLAIKGGYLEVVKVLLEHADGEKCGLDSTNVEGNSPLHLAIEEGHVEVVKQLLERAGTKLELNKKNYIRNGCNTPLHLAAEAGQDEIVAMLLAFDATKQTTESDSTEMNNDQKRTTKLNLNATNEEENTPLHLACKEGHDEVVDVMLKRVGELALDAINIRGNTPLHLAAINGHVDIVNKLLKLEGEVDLNGRNKKEQTALHFATIKCHPNVVKALCLAKEERLRANLQDKNGKTCLQYAKEGQQNRKSKLLDRSKFKFLLESQRKEKFEEITNRLAERSDVKEFLERQYRDVANAANALLVGGALIAGITFASWLQPPLGYTTDYQFPQSSLGTPPGVFESFAAVELHYSLRLFWVFNTLSFFFAIGTVMSGAKAAFPDLDTTFIVVALRSVRKELQWTSVLLLCSVVTVLGAFVCAGFAVLPPIQKDMTSMKISVVIGLAICSWTIIKFLGKLRESFAKVLEREQKDDETEEETTSKGYNLCVSLHKKFWAWLQTVCFMQGEVNTDDKMETEDSQTWLNRKTSSDLLVVTTSKLSQHVRSGEWAEDNWVCGAIQSYQAATWHEQTMSYYFEIKIKDNFDTLVSIGFTNENFKNDRLPGQYSNTYGYDGDGCFFYDGLYGNNKEGVIQDLGVDFDLRYTRGDTVGAGVNYVTGEMFFTKNQTLVGLMRCNLKTTLYPTFGFMTRGSKPITNVEVNFKGPYNFDVSHYMRHSNLKTPKKWSLQPKLAFPPFFQ